MANINLYHEILTDEATKIFSKYQKIITQIEDITVIQYYGENMIYEEDLSSGHISEYEVFYKNQMIFQQVRGNDQESYIEEIALFCEMLLLYNHVFEVELREIEILSDLFEIAQGGLPLPILH